MENIMELEIRPGPEPDSYVVEVLRSVGGGAPSSTFTLDLDDLLGRRNQLEDSVLSSSVSARRVVSSQEAAIQAVGRLLFDSVFAGDVHTAYRTSLAVASDRGKGVRVVLRLTAPGLAALPWEAAFDSETGTYLSRKEPLVRQVPAAYSPPALSVKPPLRVLGMVSSPRGLPQLDVEGEKALLEEALRPHLDADRVRIDWIDQVTWPRVHDKLLEREWHVLHFIGHGTYDTETEEGILAFEGRDGRADYVSASSLADLLDEAQPTPRLVFLNSCRSATGGSDDLFSGIAAALVHSGIHAVTAMQFSISDTAAIEFARGFYAALAHGRGIDEAVRSGRIGILGVARGTLEWVTPVLYLRGEDTRLFDVVPAVPTPVDSTDAGVPGRAPPESDHDSPSSGMPPTPFTPPIPTIAAPPDVDEHPVDLLAPEPKPPDEPPPEPQPPDEPPAAAQPPDEPPAAAQPPDEPPPEAQPPDEPPAEPPPPDDGHEGPVPRDGEPQVPNPQHPHKRALIIGGVAAAALAVAGVIAAIALSRGPTVATPEDTQSSVSSDAPTPNPEPTTTTLEVPMASPWTPTGVQCAAGDTLEISASGTAKHADNDDPRSTVGPEGLDQPGEEWFWQFNVEGLPDTPTASLIGSLDELQPFFPVGRGTSYVCPRDGELALGINDVGLEGNSGSFDVSITHIPAG